jgi:predicted ATPase
MVQRRLDRLPESVREVVRAAALLGRYFWAGGVAAVLEREVDDDLATAEKEEIVLMQGEASSRVAGQAQWMFRQSLVRDAAYASLLEDDRKTMHIAAAEWLESVGNVDLGLVAFHFERGDDKTRAAQLYARASQQALASFGQMEMAIDLAQRGLDCGAEGEDRAQLLLTRAHVLNSTGNLTACMEAAGRPRRPPPGSRSSASSARA